MSASKNAVAAGAAFLLREARREDLENPGLLSRYFVSADPWIGRDLETTAMRELLAGRHASGRTEVFAEGIDGSIGCLIAEDKPWDSAMISVACGSLVVLANSHTALSRHQIASCMLEHWLQATPTASARLVSTRIPADDTVLLHALEDHGFHVLVPMVTLGKKLGKLEVVLPRGTHLSVVEPKDIDQIEKFAATAFQWGRFTVDPRVPRQGAEQVHRTWARNCCLGTQAKHVLVVRNKNEVLGFIALKFHMAGTIQVGSIELIATPESSRGMGIGRALVRAGCNWLSNTAGYVVVRTELSNIPALRLYEGQEFRALTSSLCLSRWCDSREQ